MKYWLYDNDRVLGPFAPEELAARPSFSTRALVCPEAARGDRPDDWQEAQAIPELVALSLRQAALVTASVRPPAAAPDPDLLETVTLRGMREKLGELEAQIGYLNDGLKIKDAELERARGALDEKERDAAALRQKWDEVSSSLAELARLRGAMAEAGTAKRDLEAAAEEHRRALKELAGELAALKIPPPAPAPAVVKEPEPRPWLNPVTGVLLGFALGTLAFGAYLLGRHSAETVVAPPPLPPAVAAPAPPAVAVERPRPAPAVPAVTRRKGRPTRNVPAPKAARPAPRPASGVSQAQLESLLGGPRRPDSRPAPESAPASRTLSEDQLDLLLLRRPRDSARP